MVGNVVRASTLCVATTLLGACGASETPAAPSSAALPAATTGTVQGVVKHEAYSSHGYFPEGPVVGAQVLVTDGPGAGQSVTTTADGAYRFELPTGAFRVRWSGQAQGFETRDSDPGTVTAGATTTLDAVILRRQSSVPISEWSISGTVSDSVGNPIAAASIVVEDFELLYGTTSTDTGGHFRFASTHRHGGLRVTVTKQGYTSPEGYGAGEAFVMCGPTCAETVNLRLLRVVREMLDGPSTMRVGDMAPLSVTADYDDGSHRVFKCCSSFVSSNPAVARVEPSMEAPYQTYVKAVTPGTATLTAPFGIAQPLTLNIRVLP